MCPTAVVYAVLGEVVGGCLFCGTGLVWDVGYELTMAVANLDTTPAPPAPHSSTHPGQDAHLSLASA